MQVNFRNFPTYRQNTSFYGLNIQPIEVGQIFKPLEDDVVKLTLTKAKTSIGNVLPDPSDINIDFDDFDVDFDDFDFIGNKFLNADDDNDNNDNDVNNQTEENR